MNTTNQAYVPGVCNINRAEVAYRRKAGFFGLGLAIVIAAVFVALDVNRFLYILLFVPLFIATIGYLQVKNTFCVSYGASGKQNATDGSDAASSITDKAAVAKDKQRSRQMNLQAAGMALLVTVLAVALLPMIR